MRGRNNEGSVVLDRRIGVWNFFWWDHGNRRTKKIGCLSQYPTKASAWRAARDFRRLLENKTPANGGAPTLLLLIDQYAVFESCPERRDGLTRREKTFVS